MSKNSQSTVERCSCWCGLGWRIKKCCPRKLCGFLNRANNGVLNAFRRRRREDQPMESFPSEVIKEGSGAEKQRRRGKKRSTRTAKEGDEKFHCLIKTTKEPVKEPRQLIEKRPRSSTSSCDYVEKRRRNEEQVGRGRNTEISLSLSSLKFHSVLGQGGFGKVMLASCVGRNSPVAVKMIRKKHTRIMNILKEKRTLELARNSPFLCRGYAAFQTQTSVFFLMEHMPGGSLQMFMAREGSMAETTARFYSAEIVCGIQYLHSRGIIHRDLKPGNVLLDGEGHAKICDFGLVAENICGNTLTSERCGTFLYMAPEIHLGKEYGAAVDWWSLGVMLFRMLNAGEYPFYHKSSRKAAAYSIIHENPKYARPLGPPAVDILTGLLHKNPQHRLGVTGDIRQHPFFLPINWTEIENRRIAPPHQHSGTSNLHPKAVQQGPSSLKITQDTSCLSNGHVLFGLSFASPDLMP